MKEYVENVILSHKPELVLGFGRYSSHHLENHFGNPVNWPKYRLKTLGATGYRKLSEVYNLWN